MSCPTGRTVAVAGVVTSCVMTLIAVGRGPWTTSVRKMATTARRPNTYTVNASGTHTGSVIFFHGLGDTGQGWSEMFRQIREPHIKYIFPTATSVPVTLNGGMRMPSWFDLYTLQKSGREDGDGIKKAVKDVVEQLMSEEENAGISSDRIVIGGFSQGGALALYSALTASKRVAGAMALSSWLPLGMDFPKAALLNKDIPVLLCHGDSDPMVALEVGLATKAKLAEFMPNITDKIYPDLGHSSSQEEMIDVRNFIRKCLPPK